jgi:hypothetical protein
VADRLDYLQDLGITAIYLNPIFQSAANHRYHTHDYYHVDPILGGDAAFHTLVEAAHARSIRIVLDGVFNHASRGFFPLQSHPGERPGLSVPGTGSPCTASRSTPTRRAANPTTPHGGDCARCPN